MKRTASFFIIGILSALLFQEIYGQVGIGTENPDNSAALHVESTSGGILFPRMTTSQQRFIANPTAGLIVFNLDSADFYGFDGNVWKSLWDYPGDTILPNLCLADSIEYQSVWYSIVPIGDQCWMAENLVAPRYNDSTAIPLVSDSAAWVTLTSPGYCWYDNDSATYASTYGALYNYYVVSETNSRNICPVGWHIPTDDEWKILEGTVDTQYGVGDPEWDADGNRGYDAGKRLKSTSGWYNNGNGTNVFGFSAHPGGARSTTGNFVDLGYSGNFWSSTPYGISFAWHRTLYYYFDGVNRNHFIKGYGFSVRCLKD